MEIAGFTVETEMLIMVGVLLLLIGFMLMYNTTKNGSADLHQEGESCDGEKCALS